MDEIVKGLYRLGSPQYPAFLLLGRHRIVQVDAGPAFMGPLYLREIRQLLGKGRGPDFLLHTHSHGDHVGSTPFLRRHLPGMKLVGSETFARRLSHSKTRKTITDLNLALVHKNKMDRHFISGDFDYGTLTVERILKDGDLVDLGGGALIEVIATPGHTPDGLSFFVPDQDVVLAGDAIGIIPGDDFWVAPQFLSDYGDYLGAIERLRNKKPKTILLGHHSIIREGECERFFNAAVADCKAFRKKIEQYLQEARMEEETVIRRVHTDEYHSLRRGRQPEAAFLLNLSAQVRLIAKSMKREGIGPKAVQEDLSDPKS